MDTLGLLRTVDAEPPADIVYAAAQNVFVDAAAAADPLSRTGL